MINKSIKVDMNGKGMLQIYLYVDDDMPVGKIKECMVNALAHAFAEINEDIFREKFNGQSNIKPKGIL